jgi:hypothetical protein
LFVAGKSKKWTATSPSQSTERRPSEFQDAADSAFERSAAWLFHAKASLYARPIVRITIQYNYFLDFIAVSCMMILFLEFGEQKQKDFPCLHATRRPGIPPNRYLIAPSKDGRVRPCFVDMS